MGPNNIDTHKRRADEWAIYSVGMRLFIGTNASSQNNWSHFQPIIISDVFGRENIRTSFVNEYNVQLKVV